MDRAAIEAEIAKLKDQHRQSVETAQQALGAIGALQWVLSGMDAPVVVDIPEMTEKQLLKALSGIEAREENFSKEL